MNRNYCKTDTYSVAYAPDFLVRPDGSRNDSPTREDYAAQNWLVNAIQPPSPPEGKVLSSTRYEARDGSVYSVYEYADAPKVYRVFSKLKIEIYLLQRGKLDRLDAFLDDTLISGTNYALRRFYDQATNISEDHPMFAAYVEQAATALGLTVYEMDAMLNDCQWED